MPRWMYEDERDPLDRPIFGTGPITWWTLIALLVGLFIVLTRFWALSSRAYCHDESIHAWESWRLYTGQGYIHDPTYHGPFLYHITALVFALFGDNDVTPRIATSLFGVLIALSPLLFKKWLGKNGALLAMVLMAVSPVLMHRSRFIRHDHFAILANLLLFYVILQYLEGRETKYLYWAAAAVALGFTGKETTFITYFIFGTFLALYYLARLWQEGRRVWRTEPVFDLLIVIGTLIMPLGSPLVIVLLGHDPLDYSPGGIYFSAAVFLVVLAVSVGIGLWWDRRRWPVCAGIFYGIFVPFFTTMFTNGRGFATGMIGQLGYWLAQHGVKRGGQPWFYYLVLLPLYEFLPILLSIAGTVYYALRGGAPARTEEPHDEAMGPSGSSEPSALPVVPFIIYWGAMAFLMYSWAGEKMPWLMMHLVVPMHLLGGWILGHLVQADWHTLWERGALWLLLLFPLLVYTLGRVIALRPLGGTTTEELYRAMAWFLALAVAFIAAAFVRRLLRRLNRREGWRMFALSGVAVLLALTVRFAWMASFINADVANEFLVYAQGAPDVRIVAQELTTLSQRLTGGLFLKVAYDSEASWPFVWYLRNFENAQFFGDKPAGPLDADVVLVGLGNEAATKPFLGDRYYRRVYRLIWWPNQNWYMNMTLKGLWRDLQDKTARQKLWNVIFYRKYDVSLASWPFVSEIAMYIRRDIVQQLWDYGPEALLTTGPLPGDEYAAKWSQVAASAIWGSPGREPGQFMAPKGMALDRAGNLYVADSQNHRIQVLDAQGRLIRVWGSEGTAPGQFKEPWGVAVAEDGTVYVADTWNHRIQVFDAEGNFLWMWGTFGQVLDPKTFPNLFYGPRDIAIDAAGYIYVADTGNKRIVKYDSFGQMVGAVGGEGSGDGQMLEPVGIAIGPDGALYVADTWNQRIQVFDANLRFLRKWPIYTWSGMSVVNKPYLAVDQFGNVYATDPEGYRILQFDAQGQVLATWGQYGADAFSMNLPTGIEVDGSGAIYVSDSENGRILVFRGANGG